MIQISLKNKIHKRLFNFVPKRSNETYSLSLVLNFCCVTLKVSFSSLLRLRYGNPDCVVQDRRNFEVSSIPSRRISDNFCNNTSESTDLYAFELRYSASFE